MIQNRAAAWPPSNLPPQAGEGFSPAGLRLTAFSTLAAVAVVWIYAALELRPLFADGFLYFLRILEHQSFWFEAPARRTVELVRQLPLLAALKLGVGDVRALALVFGLSIQLLPVALVLLCWPALPRERKHFFVFPLLQFVAGALGAAFAPIAEGATAAAYFWLLFIVLLFRPARRRTLALAAALALGTPLLHEGMALLAPLLAAVCLGRARREETRAARIALLALALWFAAVTAVAAGFIAFPSHPANRDAFATALVSLWWAMGLWGSVNWPAVFGVGALAILALVACLPPGGRLARHAWLLSGAFGAAALAAAIFAVASGQMFAAQAQFNARNHAILLSLPLAAAAFTFAVKPVALSLAALRQATVLCAWLATAALVWHVEAVRLWSDYVGAFRQVLRAQRGLVGWEETLTALPPRERRLMEGMSHFWIEPTMSIVLAPDGKVAAIIAARRAAGWYPFDARRPAELPRSRYWDLGPYLDALAAQTKERQP